MIIEEWLNNDQLGIDIWNKKYRHKNESLDEWFDRVSGGDEEVRKLIVAKKFLFGGRTLANRGTNKGSFSNCYSEGFVEDSLKGIMDVAKNIAMTYKSQGGEGLSLSKIRPKGSLIGGKFKSDGIVPFMEIFNTVTESVSQGGSRKGALLMSLDINHPEAETFMTIKSDLKRINKANLSMEIDDDFMKRVEIGDKEANRLFSILCEQACYYAEPGVIFTNRFRNYNLMEFVDSYQIETCNPCGEQPLGNKAGSCNLSSINISEYVLDPFTDNARFDYDSLIQDIPIYVRAMDDVLEENLPNHPLEKQRIQAIKFRNLGIGMMGIHDLCIKLGIIYGSARSIILISNISKCLFRNAVIASINLANQRGSFPGYEPSIWNATILKNAFTPEEINAFKNSNQLRNCSLISIAPCGSIGTMLNVSTGIEPWFSTHYTRNTKSLNGDKEVSYEVWAPVVKEAIDRKWHPETLITANDINSNDRINIQAAVQNFCDTAISSTLNLKKGTTPEDIKKIYISAWKQGLKGCTVFVDGSRDPILTTSSKKEPDESIVNSEPLFDHITPVSRKSLGTTYGITFCKKCACGTLYITCNRDQYGNLVEIFTHTSKGGICQANMNAVTRLISLNLRSGVKIDEIIDQIKGINCPACATCKAKGIKVDGISCPDIISKTIYETLNYNPCLDVTPVENTIEEVTQSKVKKKITSSKHICPECGEPLIANSGCYSCMSCGFSHCG